MNSDFLSQRITNLAATLTTVHQYNESDDYEYGGLVMKLHDFVDINGCITNDANQAVDIILSEAHIFPPAMGSQGVFDASYPVDIKLYKPLIDLESQDYNGDWYYGDNDFIGYYTEQSGIITGNGYIFGRLRGYGYLEFKYDFAGPLTLPGIDLLGIVLGKYVGEADISSPGFPSYADVSSFVGDGLAEAVATGTNWQSPRVGVPLWQGETVSYGLGIDLSDVATILKTGYESIGFFIEVFSLIENANSMITNTNLLSNQFQTGGSSRIYYTCKNFDDE